MKWELRIEKNARKQLDKIPAEYQRKISAVFPIIASDPYTGKKLDGKLIGLYSYQVRPYRIIYKIYKEVLVVIIIRVGHRQGVYNN
jgi:mRNA interferase RelE/StbE